MQSTQHRCSTRLATLFSLISVLVAMSLLVSCIVPPKPSTDKMIEQQKLPVIKKTPTGTPSTAEGGWTTDP